jgi:serine/threonine protein phosphatase PrpC
MQQASSAQAVLVSSQQTHGRIEIVCGGSSIKGRRPQQEDVLLIHCDSPSNQSSSHGEAHVSHGVGRGLSIVGVFDGHGGKRCSRYAAQHLPDNFYAALDEMNSRAKTDAEKAELLGSALRLAYRITHEDFARMARGDAETARPKTRQRLQEALEKAKAFDGVGFGGGGGGQGGIANGVGAMHRSFPQPEDTSFAAIRNRMIQQRMSLGSRVWDDGSTAITCLIHGNSVMVANVGDSRAVGSIAGRAVALSVDHKPNLPAERARIQNAGGTVTSMMGCHRVMGMLAMSRALGDVMIERYLSQVSLPLSLPLLYLNQVPLSLPPFLSSALARSLSLPLRYPPSRALLPVIPLTYAPC